MAEKKTVAKSTLYNEKKKVGRPKKSADVKVEEKKAINEKVEEKKPRGRPKKVVVEKVEEPKVEDAQVLAPKKRGRPKKSLEPEIVEETPVMAEKKKVGRPKKTLEAEQALVKTNKEEHKAEEEKPRGRPKKEIVQESAKTPVLTKTEEAPKEEPKKRGRPKKETALTQAEKPVEERLEEKSAPVAMKTVDEKPIPPKAPPPKKPESKAVAKETVDKEAKTPEKKVVAPVKKKHTLYSVIGIIGDIIIYPVIIIALVSSLVMFVARRNNVAPNVFGYSMVRIVSQSMEKTGYKVNDIVFLNTVPINTLKIQKSHKEIDQNGKEITVVDERGSYIAFYQYADKYDAGKIMYDVEGDLSDYELSPIDYSVRTKTPPKTTKIVFHEIVGVEKDANGVLFFTTQGTSNASADSTKIRQDYIIGEFIDSPQWLRSTFSFCASQLGMILLVVIPLGILIFFQCLSLIEQSNNILIEKKVLKGEIRYDSEEAIKANVGIEMDELKKVKFYADTPSEEKKNVEDYLWKFLDTDKRKEQEQYKVAKKAVMLYNKNPEEYWKYWRAQFNGKRKLKKFDDMYGDWKLANAKK